MRNFSLSSLNARASFIGVAVGISALMAACGGGSESDDSSATTGSSAGTSTSGSPTVHALSVTLSNLPPSTTSTTSASIGYSASGGTVYCRRDGYDPIVCPNPFVVGTSQPLAAGDHTVDFFVDSGSGIDAGAPGTSYSWTVVDSATSTASGSATSTTATTTTGTTSGAAVSTATKLSKLAAYAWEANTTSAVYMSDLTLPALGADGAVSFDTNVADPAGGARKVNFHRVRQGYAVRIGGNRSEFQLVGGTLDQDTSYWSAFAVYVPSSWGTALVSGDRQTFWQIHSQNDGSPPLSLQFNGDDGKLRWLLSGDGYDDQTLQVDASTTPRNVWIKYIVHHKKSFSGAPALEIWRGQGSGNVAYTKIVNRTTAFGYNLPGKADWIKQGLYKWTMNAYGANPDRSIYTYGEFHQKGDALYDNAVAALADL